MTGFLLWDKPFAASDEHQGGDSGAVVVFDGLVRRDAHLRPVIALEYEAHPTLAVEVGEAILRQAAERFGLIEASCVHRVGKVDVGGLAIRAICRAGHRRDAFRACEWIVDEVKAKVPIWKKEVFEDGESAWAPPGQAIGEEDLYRRQESIAEIGPDGQAALRRANVTVVGLGGLGAIVGRLLSGAGVGSLHLIDDDVVSAPDLHRQLVYSIRDIGLPKAKVLGHQCRIANPFVEVGEDVLRLNVENAKSLLQGTDLVIDAVDTFAAKFLINDACTGLGIPWIHGALSRSQGQAMVCVPGGPCLRCLWPNEPADGDIADCSSGGVFGPAANWVGALMAGEAIRRLTGAQPGLPPGQLLLVDGCDLSLRKIEVPKAPGCGCSGPSGGLEPCSQQCTSQGAETDDRHPAPLEGRSTSNEPILVEADSWAEVADWAASSAVLIDLRSEEQVANMPLLGGNVVVVGDARIRPGDLPDADRFLLICRHGVRSLQQAERLRRKGDLRFFSLAGGAERLGRT